MGVGPFAYVTFLVVFFKFNDATYDLRQSVHKTMGVLSYLFILGNVMTGSGMLALDATLFLVATFFFYRAMSDNFEAVSKPGIAVVVGFAVAIVGLNVRASAERQQAAVQREKKMRETEAELKRTLEAAAQAMQSQQLVAPEH